MRLLFCLTLLAVPAHGWEATSGAICTLTHALPQAEVRLTYDPGGPVYAITLTRRDVTWAQGPVFAIRFEGPRSLTISTARHALSDADAALTVTDTGFGNVLDGLQFNDTATALIADQALTIPLAGAAGPLAKFRACAAAPTT